MRDLALYNTVVSLFWGSPRLVVADDKPEKKKLDKEKFDKSSKWGKSSKEFKDQLKERQKEEDGKPCGKSWIPDDKECHIGKLDYKKGLDPEEQDTKSSKRHKGDKFSPNPSRSHLQGEQSGAPQQVNTPDGLLGKRVGGLMPRGDGGIYQMDDGSFQAIRFPHQIGQVGAQFVSSTLAKLMGLSAPSNYSFINKPISSHVGTAHGVVETNESPDEKSDPADLLSEKADLAKHFIVSILVQHDTVVGWEGDANLVLNANGKLVVRDYTGTLLWTQNGIRRPMRDSVPELRTLRSFDLNPQAATLFSHLQVKEVQQALASLSEIDEKDVLELVDAAKFSARDRAEIGKGLIVRKRILERLVKKGSDKNEQKSDSKD